MSTAAPVGQPAAEATDPYTAMLRGAAVPAAAAGAVSVVVAAVVAGAEGAWGGLLAVVVVLVFFSVSLVVMRATARSNPASVLAAALVTYVTKVGLLGLFLVLMQDADWASGPAFAAVALVTAAVWLGFETRAFMRQRTLIFGAEEER